MEDKIKRSGEFIIPNGIINYEKILNDYGPEGCYEIAKKLKEIADLDMQTALEESIPKTNLLLCGLGGGLDIVNCLPFKDIYKDYNVFFGSIRPLKKQKNIDTLNEQCYIIDGKNEINQHGRWAEPLLSRKIKENVFIFSRIDKNGQYTTNGLAKSLDDFCRVKNITKIIFVDGGGDSMVLTSEDTIEQSQVKDPFKGGDAFALEAIDKMMFKNNLLFTVSTGLDINYSRFLNNLENLEKENIYLGKFDLLDVNLPTYNNIANQILYLDELNDSKIKSHTGVVLYHALNKNYGVQRTYVNWEGIVDGKPGVKVLPQHSIVYMFNATYIHYYKLKLNGIIK